MYGHSQAKKCRWILPYIRPRRCAESWHNGRFVLEQETNAYAVAAGEPVARLRLEEAVLRGTLAGTEAAARAINARTAVASGFSSLDGRVGSVEPTG